MITYSYRFVSHTPMAQLTNSLNYLFSASLLLFVLFHCLCFRFSLVAACSNSTDDQQIQHHHHRKWVGPSGHKVITVSLNGNAQFRSVQDAVDSIPKNNNMSIVIKIAPGFYREKVVVPATKPYITFKGAGREVTAIEWHDRASDRGPDGQQLRTYQTASVTVYANYFSARNISFTNTAPAPLPGMQGWQAVAFRISGDKAFFSGCGFYGAQDTLCDDAGRHYFKECYIEGSIDFIFGNGRSMYKDCELHSIASRFGSIAAHGRTCPEEKTGFAFVGCRVTGTGPLYVGRAMGQYSRIVYAYTYFDALVAHGGWDDWDHKSNKSKTAFFGVYNCYGPGAAATRGVSWARALDYDSAHPFIAKSFVNGRHWIAPRDA